MALSAATASSLFPASMRIHVVFGCRTYRRPDSGLRVRLPKIVVTVVDIAVVDGHHLVTRIFYYGLLHDGAAKVLHHCPVSIFTIQRDSEGQAGSPWSDDVMCAQVGEPNKQLLVLVDRARVIGYHNGLPHALDGGTYKD